jgi:hypothetical protein
MASVMTEDTDTTNGRSVYQTVDDGWMRSMDFKADITGPCPYRVSRRSARSSRRRADTTRLKTHGLGRGSTRPTINIQG